MRKISKFGIALVSVFALTAVVAAAAFASYNSEIVTTNMTGTSTTNQVFNTKFGEVKCTSGTFTGSQTGTEKAAKNFAATTTEVHPAYTGCTALGFSATVETTGCNYKFNATEGSATPEASSVSIICETGKSIHIVAAGGLCSVNVSGGATNANVGKVGLMTVGAGTSREVEVVSKANNISYEGVGGLCSGAGTGGTYTGTVKVKGTNPTGGAQVGVFVE